VLDVKRTSETFSFPILIIMFTISTEQINLIISNMTGLITDLMPLILFIMGIAVGLWIISSLVNKGDDLTDEEITQILRARRNKDIDDDF